jgi:hypothetical protein
MQHYETFCKEFAEGGLGQCGGPKVLLPQTVEIKGGAPMIIDGEFGFDCQLSFPEIEPALKKIQESFKGLDPKPSVRVTLFDKDNHSRIRLYPHNDVELYLSGL